MAGVGGPKHAGLGNRHRCVVLVLEHRTSHRHSRNGVGLLQAPPCRAYSAVTAALLLKAVGSRVTCIFVDNGLLRAGEAESVRETFRGHFGADLHVVDAREQFLSALAGVNDPQEKRRIIAFAHDHPLDGYRRQTFMMLDADVVAASPTSVWRVLHQAGLLARVNGKPSRKGTGFVQPLRAHEHWHVDVSYLNIAGTFYFLCSILDGYSRFIVHWEIRK